MNKHILFITIFLLLLTTNANAESFNLLQLKYSPWGGVDGDEDEFYDADNYDHYDLSLSAVMVRVNRKEFLLFPSKKLHRY